jgi:hypothetical protein
MYCRYCGEKLEIKARYCAICGAVAPNSQEVAKKVKFYANQRGIKQTISQSHRMYKDKQCDEDELVSKGGVIK